MSVSGETYLQGFLSYFRQSRPGKGRLVQRFVNNYTNRVGCGFECAGIKTQA